MRLFFAIPLDPLTADRIHIWLKQQNINRNIKAVNVHNYHITLCFLGEVDRQLLELWIQRATELVKNIKPSQFNLKLNNAGIFEKPKVAWIAPDVCPDNLLILAQGLRNIAKASGNMQFKKYRPHLTLFRSAKQNFVVKTEFEFKFCANEFILFESESTTSGVRYHPLKCWKLAPA